MPEDMAQRNKKMNVLMVVALVFAVIALVVAMFIIAGEKDTMPSVDENAAAVMQTKKDNNSITNMKYAIIHTEKGDMKAELYEKETPGTVANFVKLAESGFYDSLTFHRVIPDFVIQGGCPDGTGAGGPGYTIKCETSAPRQYHDRGVLSMAHRGPNTGGSQFFICHNRENTAHLDGKHTAFGQVVEGLDVIDAIRQGDLILGIDIIDE